MYVDVLIDVHSSMEAGKEGYRVSETEGEMRETRGKRERE